MVGKIIISGLIIPQALAEAIHGAQERACTVPLGTVNLCPLSKAPWKLYAGIFPNHRVVLSLVNRHELKRYLCFLSAHRAVKITHLPAEQLHL